MRESDRLPILPFVAVGLLAVGSITYEFWAYPTYSQRTYPEEIAQVISIVAVLAVAFILSRRRPGNPTWKLVLWFCACGLFQDLGQPFRVVMIFESALDQLVTPAFAHLVLAYPSGVLTRRSQRWLVGAGYAMAIFVGAISAIFRQPVQYTLIHGHFPWVNPVSDWVEQSLTLVAVVGLILLIAAARRAPSLSRPLRAPLYVAAAISTVVYLLIALQLLGLGDSARNIWYYLALQGLVPVALALGILAERRGRGVVADLLIELEQSSVDQLEPVLGTALRDPALTVRFILGDGARVDLRGETVATEIPPDRAVLTVHGSEGEIAEIVHHKLLADQPDLLRSVAAAARFALENARMQAQLRAQVDELRGSRERIVEAAEAERRRIERNLHDGAQQQLIALGMKLDEVRRGLRQPAVMTSTAATGALDDAVESLRLTLGELQALARGVHPPILTARGLVPAVRSLLDRLPLTITMRVDDPGRLDPAIEAAAYYVISEALTNAMRHAQAIRIEVGIERRASELHVRISDDGVGGADPTSDGLRLLADRVAAVGGTLSIASERATGTQVVARMPCE
jgi:signal transduction histidine kinase